MNFLNKSQLKFLKSLSKKKTILRKDISDSEMEIVYFLQDEKLIYVEREFLPIQFIRESHTYTNDGEILSVSIHPRGDAFLAELKHQRRYFWIPIIIDAALSVAAIVISIIALASCPC